MAVLFARDGKHHAGRTIVLLLIFLCCSAKAQGHHVVLLPVEGLIGPASADFVHRGIKRAEEEGASLVVLQLDTPGGFDTAMRMIIKDILDASVPIAGFVAPRGSRAASAGTFILYACHLAAMAPATNLGAATPVPLGPGWSSFPAAPEKKIARDSEPSAKQATTVPSHHNRPVPIDAKSAKIVADAAAYIRSLAQLRGRNLPFALQAVQEGASLSAQEALEHGVIDLMAEDLADLRAQIDGRMVRLAQGPQVLQLKNTPVLTVVPDWRNKALTLVTNPQIAFFLLLLGGYGLFFEFTSPGFGVPGVAGIISLLLALYALQLLPVNWAGVLLLLVAAVMMLAEAFVSSFGALGIGGIAAFICGGVLLFDAAIPGFGLPLGLVVGLGVTSAAVLLLIGNLAVQSFKRPPQTGTEEMVGLIGTVVTPAENGQWWVQIRGERWLGRAVAAVEPGNMVRIIGMQGLVVEFDPIGEGKGDCHEC